ncbi:hypothetical protein [Hymenobacter arizonensis]|uniref:Uncharacterized protein n=1 Tax=Hymenobacter arizonensis TaxID=1227077 RepID=A0A1I5Y978_HYMAR|nr:hypothetical protein [Hymenobacter arizonensis]SFQ40744.1 hypothetical protein SAMN04515668_2306 [Hymenobacter arizonensis]
MADHAALGHFLPYLLRRRLLAVVWPTEGGERTTSLLILAIAVFYGAGLGLLLNTASESENIAELMPKLLIGLNATLLVSSLLVDFVPSFRPVTRPLPEHFPVSARLNVVTAFLLDFISLRRLTMAVGLLTALLVAPSHTSVLGFGVLLLLAGGTLSFNLRLLFSLQRWHHPLMVLHVASLGLMAWWMSNPEGPYYVALGLGTALLPWLLWAVQLRWLGPFFSARYLPVEAPVASTSNQLLLRLSPEWKLYVRKTWLPLLIGLVFKLIMVGFGGYLLNKEGKPPQTGFFTVFFMAFLPAIGFTYVNNNFFGFMGPLVSNELQRLGLTRRLLGLYARLVGAVVLVDCLLSVALLAGLFPSSGGKMLGLLPLASASFLSLGLWGSLYRAQPVSKSIDFAKMRTNTSQLMSLGTMSVGAFLYFVPLWWVRILVAALLAASVAWPVRAVLRNDGDLRRRLWRSIGA